MYFYLINGKYGGIGGAVFGVEVGINNA